MTRPFLIAGLTFLLALPAAADDLIRKSSPHSVTDTMDKLEAAVTGAGATIFARVDHAAGAAKVDLPLADAQLLIFGNPKLGTPAMQAGITAGLDLPMRVLVHEDADGKVQVVYRAPSSLASDHAIPADAEVLMKMTGALNKLTGVAIAE